MAGKAHVPRHLRERVARRQVRVRTMPLRQADTRARSTK
jgi:hypothetical protein